MEGTFGKLVSEKNMVKSCQLDFREYFSVLENIF